MKAILTVSPFCAKAAPAAKNRAEAATILSVNFMEVSRCVA